MKLPDSRNNQHVVNLSVLLISATAAWFAPLQTFLLAYAVMGPFHYLTEIAWLRKKDFYCSDGFIPPRLFATISLLLCGVACLDVYLRRGWAPYAIGCLVVLAFGGLTKSVPALAVAVGICIVMRYVFHGYGLLVAVFLPTVIHVYVFTLIFVVAGALRAGRRAFLSWLNPVLLVAIPILLVKATADGAAPGAYWMTSESTFAPVHEYIAGVMGLTLHFDPSRVLEPAAVAVFRFLGFIYLHHYLNWFAKTELLAWHKVSRSSWAAIAVLYAAALGCYAYSFAAGFYAAYFLSMLHVLLELPLDLRSGTTVVTAPWKAWQARVNGQALRLASDAPRPKM